MKLKIFPKVFLFTFSMMLMITLFAHGLILLQIMSQMLVHSPIPR